MMEDGTVVIIDDKDDNDDDNDDGIEDTKLETVVDSDGDVVRSGAVDDTPVCVNGVDTEDREVGKVEVNEVVCGGGALEVVFEAKPLTVTEAIVFVTVPTAWDTDTARLGSVTFVVLSVLIVEATALALVAPKEMPELPGAALALSSLNGPRSWCSPVPLEPLLLFPAPIRSPIFPSRPAVGLTPGGRPVLFFDFGSLESMDPEVLSSSEVPASNGTGRYGGIVFTWLPFLSFEKWY